MSNYSVTIGDNTYQFTEEEILELNIITKEDLSGHAIVNGKSIEFKGHLNSKNPKQVQIDLQGQKYSFTIKDHYDLLVAKMGLDLVQKKKLSNITAPMPGLILDILIEEGQNFEEGDALLVLEAMKMENIIKAEGAGKVKKIIAKKGETVEKAQIIIDLEDQ